MAASVDDHRIAGTRAGSMLKTAQLYMECWQAPLATGPREELLAQVQRVSAPAGVKFLPDGVVHLEERHKSHEDLVDHIRERHQAYAHVLLEPFAMAADVDTSSAFLAVHFIVQSVGPVAGVEPSGWPSNGVLLERLMLDDQDRITEALVCRQMTREEGMALTVNPAGIHKPPLDDYLLQVQPDDKLTAADQVAMKDATATWVHCWDTGADLATDLPKALSPKVRQLNAYGLGKQRVPFEGHQGALEAVQKALQHVSNKNIVLSCAICHDRRAGFVHWNASMTQCPPGARAMPDLTPEDMASGDEEGPEAEQCLADPQEWSGLDYLRFDDQNRIEAILTMTMRPYSNVRANAPRGDSVD